MLKSRFLRKALPSLVDSNDSERRFRAEMVLGFALFEVLVTFLFAYSEWRWGTVVLGQVFGVSMIVILAILLDLHYNGKDERAAISLLVVLYLNVAFANFASGGQTLGANMALPTFVMFGALVLSRRGAVILTLLVLLQILVVAELRRSGIDFPVKPDPRWVASAIDRIPFFLTLAAALIGYLVKRALHRYRVELNESRAERAALFRQHALILESTGDGIHCIDRNGLIVFENPAASAMLGYSDNELVGLPAHETIHHSRPYGTSFPQADCPICATLGDGQSRRVDEDFFWRRDGSHFPVQYTVTAMRDEAGAVTGAVVTFRDISVAKQAAEALRANEKRLRDLFEFSRGLICTHTLDGVLTSVNPAAARALGFEPADLIGKNLRELVSERSRPFFEDYLERIRSGVDDGVIPLVARDGTEHFWEYSNRLCHSADGSHYVLGNATDTTERRELERELREQSLRDPLTGCFNRRYLSLQAAEMDADAAWGCVVVDLDHFKQINDQQGHQRGDEILVATGRFLNRCVRSGDFVIRMGGDEFLCLLPGADAATTEAVATRIASEVRVGPRCDLSIGHAARKDAEPLQQTIDRADRHLYRIRSAARGAERRAPTGL
jgi:diguanylate cyclase (GGDEF)-like protein/PAS domain S-box-containing protein